MKKLKAFWKVFKNASYGFVDDNAFKLSASLSYYTVFALAPLLIIIISLTGIFFGRDAMQDRIYMQLKGLIGSEAAMQVQDIIQNIHTAHSSTAGAIIGIIILFIGATGVFTEMQDSINYIWSVKAKPKRSWVKYLANRLLSFSLIIGMAFLLLVSLIVNALLSFLSDSLMRLLPQYTVQLFYVVNTLVILSSISGLFAVIFKVLPDAIIEWRDAIMGSVFTALLFLLGKLLINYYIGKANLGITYGAAASIVIILVWVYYSSMILFFGAEFTKMYALSHGEGIRPKETAVFIIKKEAKEISLSHLET
ncbi:YihY/virulence factor BrkB family protein [Chitinophagaceae bacterium LB-8]|uniref:YihY/virulence factor BrkB family protein n=1 Tax=Paraflavisolibacter caeni TaxID=2982496 RepID=A0A9X2XVT2_9BACT|nr:YihY/virulence factor BrkB family protein [Paraflavisolibacter caeni]MCU7549541.1 YihY/virulence factor BrkB family protein [Paraflavisolibacter caeni]